MTRLIDPVLFTDDLDAAGTPALAGARCGECATTTFPVQDGCPRCGAAAMSRVALPRSGTVWSSTVQHFAPKPPFRHDGEFVPFALGYVDLGDVIVETRFTENHLQDVDIGAAVTLALVPAFTDADGTTVLTFAFGPSAGGGA